MVQSVLIVTKMKGKSKANFLKDLSQPIPDDILFRVQDSLRVARPWQFHSVIS
jgi:hypothetical protein